MSRNVVTSRTILLISTSLMYLVVSETLQHILEKNKNVFLEINCFFFMYVSSEDADIDIYDKKSTEIPIYIVKIGTLYIHMLCTLRIDFPQY